MRALRLAAQQLGSRPRCVRHFATNTAAAAAIQDADRTLQDLCRLYGIEAAVRVSRGTWGLSLFRNNSCQQHQEQLRPATVQCTPTSRNLQASSKHEKDAVVNQQFMQHNMVEQPHRQHQANTATSDQDTLSQETRQQQQQQHSNFQQQRETLLQQQQRSSDELLVSVPLHLVLSCNIPGCSPSPADTPPALHTLLHSSSSSCSRHWEMQLAALLLWAVRQPHDSQLGGFWRRYAAELLPSLNEQAGLLLWSEQELEQLQDGELEVTALAWQEEVHQAYYAAVQPAFDSMADAGCGAYQASSSSSRDSSQSCTLDEWRWAVGAVESRAFGVMRTQGSSSATLLDTTRSSSRSSSSSTSSSSGSSAASLDSQSDSSSSAAAAAANSQSDSTLQQPAAGSRLVGMVPVLDLANHTCRSSCHHAVDYEAGKFNLYISGSSSSSTDRSSRGSSSSSSSVGQQPGVDAPASQETAQEVLITYGDKDNRHLMEQYGFIVPGNPYDRVQFDQQGQRQQQQQQQWMSHTAVKQAAQQVKQQLQQQAATNSVLGFTAAHVDGAVASVISAAGWTNLRHYKQVTAGSTVARAQQLLASVQAQLAGFPTTAAEDRLLLQQISRRLRKGRQAWKVRQGSSKSDAGNGWDVSDRRLFAAVQYRLERKALLEAAMHVLQGIHGESG